MHMSSNQNKRKTGSPKRRGAHQPTTRSPGIGKLKTSIDYGSTVSNDAHNGSTKQATEEAGNVAGAPTTTSPLNALLRLTQKLQQKRQLESHIGGDVDPTQNIVIGMICERERYRQRDDFENADRIREILNRMGVRVYDKQARWSAVDGRGGAIVPYDQGVCCQMSDAQIETHVTRRLNALDEKNYKEMAKVSTPSTPPTHL